MSPSSITVNVPLGTLLVSGSNFTSDALVAIDGQLVPTFPLNATTLQAQITSNLDYVAANHQITVQQNTGTSNTISFAVYAPAQGPIEMNAIPGFLVGTESDPPWIAATDIDGDGLADVLVPNDVPGGSGGIAILKGQSNGTLASATVLSMTTPDGLLVGDVDGDGLPDLVAITQGTNVSIITTFHGDGHGNFQQTATAQIPFVGNPVYEFLADLDGDGKLDLVYSAFTCLEWVRNTGGGNFPAPVTLASANQINYFSIGDLNQDGKIDLVYEILSPANTATVHTLLNQGSGQFTDTATAGLNGVGGLPTLIDFNLDGIPDLVVQAVQNQFVVLYSFTAKGDGSFQQVASAVIATVNYHVYLFVVGDFDHDGLPDLAGIDGETEPSHILYLFGDGHGNFLPQTVVGPQGDLITEADVNGDHLPDVIVPDRFSFVSLALGRTDRNFPSGVALTPLVAVANSAGDINGDSLGDIFVGGLLGLGTPISGTVFQNQGNDTFQQVATTDPGSMLLADLTGRGVVDLLGFYNNDPAVWPNNGTFGFSTSPLALPPGNGSLMVADMDGDGHPDVVTSSAIFYGNGAYGFTAVNLPTSATGPYVIGDFNGDGKQDIAIPGSVLVNAGGRSFNVVPNTDLPLLFGSAEAFGDFNGDGRDDVAISASGNQTIEIYYGQTDGTFALATSLYCVNQPGGLVVADFDGDGRPDVAAGLILAQQAVIFFNQGNGRFSKSFFASGADTTALTAYDLSHRGKTDLIFTNFEVNFRPPNVDVIYHK